MPEQNQVPTHTTAVHGAASRNPSPGTDDAPAAPAATAPQAAPAPAAGTRGAADSPAPSGAVAPASPGAETSAGARSGRASRAKTTRARAPRQDAVLTEAVALAREAVVLGGADASGVGEHVGVRVHDDRLLSHLFDCELPGYPGWTWYATVARAPRSKHVTVCESGLLAGPRSLLAPEWVPWEERMQSVQDQEAEGQGGSEGSDPSISPAGTEHTSDTAGDGPSSESVPPEGPVRATEPFQSTADPAAGASSGTVDAPARQDTGNGDAEGSATDTSGDAGAAAHTRAVVVPPADPFDTGAQLPDSPRPEDGASS